MSRRAQVWWNDQKGTWCTELGGTRQTLAKGKGNRRQAETALRRLLDERQLLSDVNGAISVAGLCEHFLQDAEQHLARSTYVSYAYSLQKLVDLFGLRPAHTVEPLDIAKFTRELQSKLNPTSQAIVLRVVQRCFNWGVENRVIPPHKLGRIRKPRPLRRERFLTDDEFQTLLRSTNGENHHRDGAAFRRFLLAMEWTLCRPGELARLEWKHIHFDQQLALLPEHKTKRTGKPKVIPLIPKFERLLRWLQSRHTGDRCLLNARGKPWTPSSLNLRMRRLRKRTGLVDVVPYTLRHRGATNAILKTGDLKMTSLVLGHSSVATTERYLHLANEALVEFSRRALG
ncbi:MAG: site-specific integrase [Bythopirellula sp.]|nr:site-specific integrase [Bythopirellula sp.]